MTSPVPLRSHNQEAALGPKSRAEFERSKVLTPGGSMRASTFFAPHPPYAASGSGSWITDVDGRRIFDCANNFFSLVHGHAFPPVVAALHDAIDRGTAFGLPLPGESDLVEELRRRAPRLEQVRFVNSGTEAVMFAIKAARAITGRPAIAKFEGSYHGAYDHVEISLDSTPDNWGDADRPAAIAYAAGTSKAVIDDTVILRFNDVDGCRRLLETNAGRLAAVVFDPLASRVGMVPAFPSFLDMLQTTCRRLGILLLLDEVISFRLGYGGAHAVFGLEPDLVALAKIIGGGLPVGAIAGPASMMGVFDHTKGKPLVSNGGTFSANPLTMAAGAAAMRAYDRAAIDRMGVLGEQLRTNVNEGFARDGVPAQVTGLGSLFRLHPARRPIEDYRSCYQSPVEKAAIASIHFDLLERGFLLTPNCSGALSTPMSRADVEDLSAAILSAAKLVFTKSPWS